MRPVREPASVPASSHTPIYDRLYSEYLRAFRALPGDRTGEEDLGFTAFSYGGAYSGAYGNGNGGGSYGNGSGGGPAGSYGSGGSGSGSGWNSSPWQPADAWQPSYTPQPQYSYAGAGTGTGTAAGPGYANGRQHQTGMQHIPAALPPAPRRGY